MHEYYLLMECGNCDHEIIDGLCVTMIEHKGRPVISFDVGELCHFTCPECGTENYTGELEVFVEGGDELEDEDDGEG